MINSTTSVASLLSDIYNTNNSSISQVMSQIASGKRVQSPSDDFAAYVESSALNTDIAGYQTAQQNLTAAQGLANYAAGVGNDIAADLTKMQNLLTQYNATSDPNQQAAYASQYTALVNEISDEKTNSNYEFGGANIQVYKAATLGSVTVDNNNDSISIKATAVGDETAVNNITTASASDIQNEINNAQTYVAEMNAAGDEISKFSALTGTAINSEQATVGALVNVDQAAAMTNLTNLQVQQQATVSMMSQASTLQAGIARLFQ